MSPRHPPVERAETAKTLETTVILVGVRGFGAVHLANLRRLRVTRTITLIGCVDPVVRDGDPEPIDGAPLFASLADAFAAVGVPDVVIAAVPIPVHVRVAAEALAAGADVLLEKPPFASMADFDEIIALEAKSSGCVQVGFQSLGSRALTAIDADEFDIGTIRHVRAMGAWVRRSSYWNRNAWAGRRSLSGIDVVDGVVTNPLAHAVATALRIAGMTRAADIATVEVDAYRTNPIDADDTTALRIVGSASGSESGPRPTVSAALTLSASGEADQPPVVEVVGDRGTISFSYTLDEVTDTHGAVTTASRVDLLENLIDHRQSGTPLLVPLERTGAFMRVVEAMRSAPEPTRVESRFVTMRGEGPDSHPVLRDIEHWIRAAADADATFADVAAPWSFSGRDTAVANVGSLMTLQDGQGSTSTSSPHPFLHPVRTASGVELTARRPADHDWHVGVGFAVPDVDGANLWGGPTYVSGQGYQLRQDHGCQRIERVVSSRSSLTVEAAWLSVDDEPLLRERRTHEWQSIAADVWQLTLRSELSSTRRVTLGSPGSKGRQGAGYGGWFWRFPACRETDVRTGEAHGEAAVNGTSAPWLAWAADFEVAPGATGPATLVFCPADEGTASDPWFVRASDYPGVGSAIAWASPAVVTPAQPLVRSLRVIIADGRRDPEALLAAADDGV